VRRSHLLLALALAACSEKPPERWEQHAYVWTRSSASSELTSPAAVGALRVLAAQWSINDSKPWMLKSALPTIADRPAPVVVVVRLDGSSLNVSAQTVAQTLRTNLQPWLAGQALEAVEIDHDSATSRLGEYAHWIGEFRSAWGDTSPVWITALPDWRHSDSLPELLNTVDTYTLQVHALDAKESGLMNASKALDWVSQFDSKSSTPYFIALPTYALRVGVGENDSIRFVESETPAGASAAIERTLFADPVDLATLVATLRATRSERRRGIAWFRLPDSLQRNAMSMETFNVLVAGGTPERVVSAVATSVKVGGTTFDVSLGNSGKHDTGLPSEIVLGDDCEAGDVTAGYRVDTQRGVLIRTEQARFASGQPRALGWIRCGSSTPPQLRVMW
jgi:hypothetical protein